MARNQPLTATRREFCVASAAALVGLSIKGDRPLAGGFVYDDMSIGHALRARPPVGAATTAIRIPIVIVGGGIAGLSAAWRLQKRGFDRFVVLEMSGQPGGNSRSGQNETTAYPWGAHYVPIPDERATFVRELFAELGVLKPDGTWDERHLCLAQQERLFIHGRWQEGIEPAVGLTADDREQFQRFGEVTAALRASRRFTVPLDNGLAVEDESLDRLSFAAWLAAHHFDSKPLLWYLNYACRDDYGALASDVSAWAGLHYFSSRDNDEKGPLTWPEGNGWIVKRLLERVGRFVRTDQPVRAIRRDKSAFRVRAADTDYVCDAVIFAAPTFLAPHVVEGPPPLSGCEYSPWMTANLTLETIPDLDRGEPAWDNVIMSSPALGYVDAMHQSLRSVVGRPVIPRRDGLGLLEGSDPHRPGARAPAHSVVRLAAGRDAHRPRDGASDGRRGVFWATTGAEAITRSPGLRALGRERSVAVRGSAIPRRDRCRSCPWSDRVAKRPSRHCLDWNTMKAMMMTMISRAILIQLQGRSPAILPVTPFAATW